MPGKVNEFYVAGRELYLKEMNKTIARVADIVGTDLTAAKQRIATGRSQIAKYVESLPKDLQKVGSEASKEIGDRFEQLESDVDAKQEALVDTLASKYVEARKGLDERIEELQAANRGLIDKAIGAIKAIINTIRQLAAMLRNVLARVAGVVGDIISAPVRFLGNLIAGMKGGILKFKDDFLGHLRRGLMSWLFGALAEGGIELPKSFDPKGIIGFLASIFGLTWANIRNRIVKQIGEKAMGAVEQGVEIFKIISGPDGIGGVWEMMLTKLGNIKDMIFEKVKDFVQDRIITAGITWLIGLLNPAAAFIKACKLIYDVVMFFVNNASRIAKFVDTILDSVADIVRGNIGGVVNKINDVLGQMVPIIIGFLASVIGLGGIGAKVREIVQKLQKPVNQAIDFVIKTGLKIAGPIIRGIAGISSKVKAKVAVGKAWVKGKVEAGKAWAKGKVEAGKAWVKGKLPGAGKPATKGAPPAKSGDVRKQALRDLQQETGKGLPPDQIPQAVHRVAARLQSQGLKRLEAGPADKDGIVTISAAASPFLPLARLAPRGVAPKGRTVKFFGELRLSQPTAAGRAAILPTDREGRILGAGQTSVRAAGAILRQPTENVVRAVTWNTANIDTYDNVSHAEHHFVSWLSGQEDLLPRITRMHFNLQPLSPCATCTADLIRIIQLISATRGRRFARDDAVLTWTKPYSGVYPSGNNRTTAVGVEALIAAGWTVHAPPVPEGDPLRNAPVIIVPPNYRPPT